jgi:uncharacterized protein (TIGR00369 family)
MSFHRPPCGRGGLAGRGTIAAVTISLDQARAVLAAQPFSRLLGAELTAFAPGMAELRIPLRDDLLQQFGYVHGGVLAYAADNAITFAAGSVLGPAVLTRGLAIDYVRPGTPDVLRAAASVLTHTDRQAVCRVELYTGVGADETLCAAAQGTVNTSRRVG